VRASGAGERAPHAHHRREDLRHGRGRMTRGGPCPLPGP
jgi:hypothetical protein